MGNNLFLKTFSTHYPLYSNFKCAINFSSDGLFINPGKAAVDGVGISENRVVVAGGRISIIFISNGCVAACNLTIPGTSGSGVHINGVKKIGIWPLNEEFDALTAYFGAVYGVSQFYCNFFGDILTFQTQIEKTSSSSSLMRLQCKVLFFIFIFIWNLIKMI